jgi:hypothetical protein
LARLQTISLELDLEDGRGASIESSSMPDQSGDLTSDATPRQATTPMTSINDDSDDVQVLTWRQKRKRKYSFHVEVGSKRQVAISDQGDHGRPQG